MLVSSTESVDISLKTLDCRARAGSKLKTLDKK